VSLLPGGRYALPGLQKFVGPRKRSAAGHEAVRQPANKNASVSGWHFE